MLILFSIIFRIVPPTQNYPNHRKKVKVSYIKDKCQDLDGTIYDENGKIFDYNTYTYCNKGTYTITNCKFSNFQMYGPKLSFWSYLIYTENANLNVLHCQMENIIFNDYFIYSKGESYQSTLSFCDIKNCTERVGYDGILYYSECKQTTVSNNTFYFSSKDMCNGLFYFYYQTNCKILGNKFENAQSNKHICIEFFNYNDGSTPTQIEDCVFTNIKGNNPSLLKMPGIKFDLTLRNITVENCDNSYIDDDDRPSGYFFSITSSLSDSKLNIKDCKFSDLTSNAEGGGGIGLWFKSYNEHQILNIVNSIFENVIHTQTSYGGGALIFNKGTDRQKLTNYKTDLTVTGCTFKKVSCSGNGGAIHFSAEECKITVTDSEFISTSSNDGHAIYINKQDDILATISNCKFTDCGDTQSTYSVLLNVKSFEFLHNEVIFTDPKVSCGCVNTNKRSQHTYKHNVFKNVNVGNSVAISEAYYSSETESLIFVNNTFDCISGQNQGRCILININDQSSLEINNNTIQNCQSGGPLMKIVFTNSATSFDLNDFILTGNTISENCYSELNSCPLIIVQNKKNDHLTLNFRNVYFENNHNPRKGGAIQIGNNLNTVNTKVTFNDCQFVGNTADESGGAIAIQTYYGCQIENCLFTENHAKQESSVIFIETEMSISNSNSPISNSEISIQSCIFLKNGENNENGIVSVDSATNANVIIDNCSFTDSKVNGYPIYLPSNINSINVLNCTIEYLNSNGYGGIFAKSNGVIEISFVNFFYSSSQYPALKIESQDQSNKISINHCSFDSCSGTDISCIDILSSTTSFLFEHNLITNNKRDAHNLYIGIIRFNNQEANLKIDNISFINNTCSSLYGGGIGLKLNNINNVIFKDCRFENNCAKQDKTQSRPTLSDDPPYYNGDGGAIQIGYYRESENMVVSFDECNFINNKAQRHGGAISIQTLKDITINDCTFTKNEANIDSNSENLLEYHFSKKVEGRGGALYINPTFSYVDESGSFSSQNENTYHILDSRFVSNKACDGYAIYIEGEEHPEIKFDIKGNNFDDNFNENNIVNGEFIGAVITTEIHNIKYDDINNNNHFSYISYDTNSIMKLSYVDHYGHTKTKAFTESDYFPSNNFTYSQAFSKSNLFTNSEEFKETNTFSESNAFSKTNSFSESNAFSKTNSFSESNAFSKSNAFLSTNKFSNSNYFSSSDNFTPSNTIKSKETTSSKSLSYDIESESNSYEFSTSNSESEEVSISNSNDASTSNSESEELSISNSNDISISNSESEAISISISNDISTSNSESEKLLISNSNDENAAPVSNSKNPPNIDISETTENVEKPNPINPTVEQTTESVNVIDRGIDNQTKSNKGINMPMIIGVVVGILAVIVVVILIIIFVIRKKREYKTSDMETNIEMSTEDQNSINSNNEFENPLCNPKQMINFDPFEQNFEEEI